MSKDLYSLWEEPIRKVAKSTVRNFTDLDEEDIFQDLMVFILENKRVGSPDNPAVMSTLAKKATSVAWEYRKNHLAGTCQYSYLASDVRKILEVAFDRDAWEAVTLPDDQISEFHDDKWVANIDVFTAVTKLPMTYKLALVARYRYGITPKDGNARNLLSRAVLRTVDYLNAGRVYEEKEHEGLGSRKVIRNATSTHIIQELA